MTMLEKTYNRKTIFDNIDKQIESCKLAFIKEITKQGLHTQ